MSATLIESRVQAIDANGVPYAYAKMYFYTVGTSTPMTVYSSSSVQNSTTSLGQYIVADGAGAFPECYLPLKSYRVVTKTSSGVTIQTRDIYDELDSDSVTTDVVADAAITAPKLSGAQTGDAPIYGARAWINCVYSTAAFTGGNISSVSKPNTGELVVNFSTPLPTADFAWSYGLTESTNALSVYLASSTTSSATFYIRRCSSDAKTNPSSNITIVFYH